MISQGDIDALVRQMSEATSSDDMGMPPDESMGGERDQKLEELLKETLVAPGDPIAATMAAPVAMMPGQTMVPSGAVMSSDELRGSKYLLVAIVLLLFMCAATMAFVVNSLNDLTSELRTAREKVDTPSDDYHDNLAYARSLLESNDTAEVGRVWPLCSV